MLCWAPTSITSASPPPSSLVPWTVSLTEDAEPLSRCRARPGRKDLGPRAHSGDIPARAPPRCSWEPHPPWNLRPRGLPLLPSRALSAFPTAPLGEEKMDETPRFPTQAPKPRLRSRWPSWCLSESKATEEAPKCGGADFQTGGGDISGAWALKEEKVATRQRQAGCHAVPLGLQAQREHEPVPGFPGVGAG